jgi:hypothetical protein
MRGLYHRIELGFAGPRLSLSRRLKGLGAIAGENHDAENDKTQYQDRDLKVSDQVIKLH